MHRRDPGFAGEEENDVQHPVSQRSVEHRDPMIQGVLAKGCKPLLGRRAMPTLAILATALDS